MSRFIACSFIALLAACSSAAPASEDLGSVHEALAHWSATAVPGTTDTTYVVAVHQNILNSPTDVFYLTGGAIAWKHFDTSIGWARAQTIVPGTTGAVFPSVVATAANQFRLFHSNASGQLCYLDWNGAAWGADACISGGGLVLSNLSAVMTSSDHFYVFYRGPNGNLTESNYLGGPWWSAPINHGITIPNAPSAVYRPTNGQFNVFYRGTNGDLFDTWFDGAMWHAGWDHGFSITGDPGAVTSSTDARIDVFWTESNNGFTIQRTAWTASGGWGGVDSIPLALGGRPSPMGPSQFFSWSFGHGVMEADYTN